MVADEDFEPGDEPALLPGLDDEDEPVLDDPDRDEPDDPGAEAAEDDDGATVVALVTVATAPLPDEQALASRAADRPATTSSRGVRERTQSLPLRFDSDDDQVTSP